MIKPGDEWGTATTAAADLHVSGDDSTLAAAIGSAPSPPLVRFHPQGSELGRAVGLSDRSGRESDEPAGIELPIDAIESSAGLAVNAIVIGVAPTRLQFHHRRSPVTVTVDGRVLFDDAATTIVIANGQFIDGVDVVPRGHPGDGRFEVQVYALNPSERLPMRQRIRTGTHLPHPRIVCTTGRTVEFTARADGGRRWSLTVDGRRTDAISVLHAAVQPKAFRLLI